MSPPPIEKTVWFVPLSGFFDWPVSGMLALSFVAETAVTSGARSIGEQFWADVALDFVPVTAPDPEVVTVFPGPAVALPLTVPPEILMFPFEAMSP